MFNPEDQLSTIEEGFLENDPPPTNKEKKNFAAKVLMWLTLEMCVMAAGCTVAYIHRNDVISWVQAHPHAMWIPIALTFVSLIMMFCTANHYAAKVISFAVFLLSLTAVMAVSILQYSPKIILMAGTGTVGICLVGALYAKSQASKGVDLVSWGPVLAGALWCILFASFVSWLIGATWTQTGIAAASLIVFTFYLIYDINQICIGKDANDPLMKDGMIASINVFLDILNLFLSLLQLLDSSE